MTPAPTAAVTRLQPFGATIFAEITELARSHDAVNLGQGFPDWDGPAAMLEVAREQIATGNNQYPPARGFADLRAAICEDRATNYGLEYCPLSETLVTVGATEAIAATMLGLVEPGSEVILIEPYYDSYAAAVALAGATRVSVPLVRDAAGFVLDVDALRAAVTDRTAMIVVNSPHNPTGHVFGPDELGAIAELAVERDLIVLADEVYERLTFDAPHLPIAGLPGMAGRTVTVSSAGKTFNVTGWKIGWALASQPLLDGVLAAKQFLTFVGGGPFQPAVAHALRHERAWVADLQDDLRRKRDLLTTALSEAGLAPFRSEGTYFVCARVDGEDAARWCRDLPAAKGVAAIPVTAFVDHEEPWRDVARFAFCKRDEVLDEGVRRLRG
ncbi:aminotransferase [Tessaracoccus aquimaris]|uniref:Aminotransferase n=1 Tax=Tessaracoccus aquimaris TaxID=1332264 RepID=A0A1Q2CSC9_9ACTN|nr:pyridoxal phosphate-dependent aminotransferase [Tessaracoccus aquimaris]AQP49007.1 aminotransferase [Tessaracoccus aquimaris]